MKIKNRDYKLIQDRMVHQSVSIQQTKKLLVLEYRFPARKAKVIAKQMLKDAIEYWDSDCY